MSEGIDLTQRLAPAPRLGAAVRCWRAGMEALRVLMTQVPNGAYGAALSRIRPRRSRCATAALIFAGDFAADASLRKVGSGRMQEEAFRCMESLGLHCRFADQHCRAYGSEIARADIIVSLCNGLVKLPMFSHSTKVLYACNTHVEERQQRLRDSARKWGLPCEDWARGRTFRGGLGLLNYLIRLRVRYICWQFRAAYRLADYLMIAENDAGVANFVRRGVPPSKILRYRNAVDTDIWVPAKEKRQPFTFVCWSSGHGLRKGLPSLVSAWRQWYRGQAAELWLVGSSTVVSDRLFGRLTQGEAAPGLRVNLASFPGQHRPVIDFIGSCHVAVFPTLEDAQPSALLEMTSCGLPVITTVESGVEFPETFCRYVARDSPGELAQAFEYWFSRRQELQGPQLAARSYIEQHHTWSCFHARFTEILTGLMARRREGKR
jgi:glycosyltransferase involved in cell wall biosynthesis